MMKPEFSPGQLALLRIVQKDLPDSPMPFLDLARATGMEESEILDFLRELKAQHNSAFRRQHKAQGIGLDA